jgi:hypothetical protein
MAIPEPGAFPIRRPLPAPALPARRLLLLSTGSLILLCRLLPAPALPLRRPTLPVNPSLPNLSRPSPERVHKWAYRLPHGRSVSVSSSLPMTPPT